MSAQQFKKVVVDAYKESAEQLKDGNERGYLILDNTLDSVTTIFDDEELFLQLAIFGRVGSFIKAQSTLEDRDKVLKELGNMLESVGKAYEANDVEKLNGLYRKWTTYVLKRWKQSLRLKQVEK